jgi:hypothetical protein
MNETRMHKSQGIIERWKNLEYVWAQNLCLQRQKKKSSTKGRHGEDLEYIPKPGEVVEGFDDLDETDSDLEDEPMPLSIEVLVLSCI